MKKYRTSKITAEFDSDINTLWRVVTNNLDYEWRSDLSKIEILEGGNEFVEYDINGNKTNFIITEKVDNYLYKFQMDNNFFDGYWEGEFIVEEGKSKIIFTENIHVKNPIMRILSYVFMDLKKMQNQYVKDLRKKLNSIKCS